MVQNPNLGYTQSVVYHVLNLAVCGIFGYYNHNVPKTRQELLDCLITGLKRLEYRGYDSAGVAIDSQVLPLDEAPEIHNLSPPPIVIKCSGKIVELENASNQELRATGVDLKELVDTHVGIAHTRWATHGPPTPINAHPHLSGPDKEFVVVHNGIITNYKALKGFLTGHGEIFVSDTDTEVIPKLLKFLYHSSPNHIPLSQLVIDACQQLHGAYALLVKSTRHPGEIVACKKGSPLILGVLDHNTPSPTQGKKDGKGAKKRPRLENPIECFLASDACAVVEHTKKVIVLEDNDVVCLKGGQYEIFNPMESASGGPRTKRLLQTLQMQVEQIMKGGFDHYMQKEIHEQPESVLQTMRGRIRVGKQYVGGAGGNPAPTLTDDITEMSMADTGHSAAGYVKLGGLTEHLQSIRRGRRIVFVGCGTSYHACLAGRKTVEDLVGIPVAMELASDMLDRQCPIFRDDTCVFVSQSGETADTLRALDYAKARGALCVGITNTVGSAIARGTHCGVHINAGCEIGVASTKAYTSQIVVITLMALALSEDSLSKRAQRDAIISSLTTLPDAIRLALALDSEMKQLAERLKTESSLLMFGRGYNYATALEGALKVKEVALMHSEGILAGEMKHGPLALVDEKMPIIVIATKDSMHSKMLSVIQQLRARSAQLIVLCCTGDEEIEGVCGEDGCLLVRVPRVVDPLQAIVNIVPLQLLAYHLTVIRGHNVDQPRNLAKSVTVTEED